MALWGEFFLMPLMVTLLLLIIGELPRCYVFWLENDFYYLELKVKTLPKYLKHLIMMVKAPNLFQMSKIKPYNLYRALISILT
jgi:hypothetical protein